MILSLLGHILTHAFPPRVVGFCNVDGDQALCMSGHRQAGYGLIEATGYLKRCCNSPGAVHVFEDVYTVG